MGSLASIVTSRPYNRSASVTSTNNNNRPRRPSSLHIPVTQTRSASSAMVSPILSVATRAIHKNLEATASGLPFPPLIFPSAEFDPHVLTQGRAALSHPHQHSVQSPYPAHYDGNVNKTSNGPVVLRRKKKQTSANLDDEDDRNLRRISYLRATKDERMVVDCSEDEEPNVPTTPKHSTAEGVEGTPRHAPSIQRIRQLFGEKGILEGGEASPGQSSIQSDSMKEGWLHCKVAAVDGKKSVDRSWRNAYVVLGGDSLNVFKDKKIGTESLEEIPQIILSESAVEIADDYTKRKNVFRLKTEAGSEVLFQADNEVGLTQWVHAVEAAINAKDRSGSQRKLTSVTSHRNRSPTGQSPASKNRKASAGRKMFHS